VPARDVDAGLDRCTINTGEVFDIGGVFAVNPVTNGQFGVFDRRR
jgi:hypothetical protein